MTNGGFSWKVGVQEEVQHSARNRGRAEKEKVDLEKRGKKLYKQ